MNKKLVALFLFPLMLAACGNEKENESNNDTFNLPQKSYFETLIEEAENVLEDSVKEVLESSPSLMIKGSVCDFYVAETAFIKGIEDVETAEKAVQTLCDHETVFVEETLKPIAYRALELELLPMIYSVKDCNTQDDALNTYYQEVERDEIGQAFDILSTNGAYVAIYNAVTSFWIEPEDPGRPEPDEPDIDPEDEELRKHIDYLNESIYMYIGMILEQKSYDGFDDQIYDYYSETLSKEFAGVTTKEEADQVAAKIKERLLGLVYEKSREAAVGDLENFFNEILGSFTRQEVIDAITPIRDLYMAHVRESMYESGTFYGDFILVIQIYEEEALFDIRSKDIKEFWRQDLRDLNALYSHEKESQQCAQEVKVLYENALQQIEDSNDILELQHDLDEIVANFQKEAKAIAEKYVS